MDIRIKEVSSSSELNSFIKFEFTHYEDSSNWVPPITQNEKTVFSKKNPMLQHGELKLILAYHKSKVVGRAIVSINQAQNEAKGILHAHFGYIEFINNIQVSKELFKYIEDWAKARDMTRIVGPHSVSSFEKVGLLYEGQEQLSSIFTTYNHAYYPKHLDSLGYAYHKKYEELVINIPAATSNNFLSDHGLKILPIPKKNGLKSLLTQSFILLKSVYSKEEGFAELTMDEANHYQKQLLPYLNPTGTIFIGNESNQLVGFGIVTSSFAEAHQKANGKLLPFGQFHISKAVKQMKLPILQMVAIHPGLQGKGIEKAILNELFVRLNKLGIQKLSVRPEMENGSHQLLAAYQPEVKKRRRTYIKEIFTVT